MSKAFFIGIALVLFPLFIAYCIVSLVCEAYQEAKYLRELKEVVQ